MAALPLGSWMTSGLVLGGVGVVFGALIAAAHRRLRVWEDPRIDAVAEILPGSNCGACGFAGCRSFAENVVEGAAPPSTCTQMTEDAVGEVAGLLGVDAGVAVKRSARLLCAGGLGLARQDASYVGLGTCRAAAAVAGGGKACPWGCLGLGDCIPVCDDDAIALDARALPVVDPDACTACGRCVDACPRGLLELRPVAHALVVQCKSALEGDTALALCDVACTACGKCIQDAPPGALELRAGIPVVADGRWDELSPDVTARCPTGAIRWVVGRQRFDARPEEVAA
ncbi:MAG: 4Fe-4S binding protein [Planctomycetes bacterium]|nr:4Fe-4S binding protein [Planctomycetota bacterium]